MKSLIIIPTYNEAENLPLLLKEIFVYVPETHVLVIDDSSPDGTGQLADRLATEDKRLHTLHREGKLGLGTAYITGFQFALARSYEVVFEMDADFSHHPRYLPDFLKAVERADLVIGSRYITGGKTPDWPMVRRLLSGCGNVLSRLVLGIPVHDCTGGFRCYRCSVLQCLELEAVKSHGYAFQIELTHRAWSQGCKIVETPITFQERKYGASKMSSSIVAEALAYIFRARLKTFHLKRKVALVRSHLQSKTIHSD